MKNVVLATALCLLGLTAPSPAHADGVGYVGTCHIATINDTTPNQALGGWNVWNGEVNLAVTASTPGDLITAASCWIKVTATGSENKILDATTLLPAPTALGAGRATYTAAISDNVYLCTHVTTTTGGAEDNCAPITRTPVCPVQVCGDGGLLDQVLAILDDVKEQANVLGPIVCPLLVTLAPTVDGLPGGLVYIDPTGDTYVPGTVDPDNLVWDCAPYVTAPALAVAPTPRVTSLNGTVSLAPPSKSQQTCTDGGQAGVVCVYLDQA